MEKNSVLKGVSPELDSNSVHATWSNGEKTFYRFTVTFENGDEGQASSTLEQPKWKVGSAYNYELTTNQYGNNIKSIKDPNAQPFTGGGGGKKSNPLTQQQIIAQSCLNRSVELVIATVIDADQIEASTDKFMGIINKLAKKHV